MAKCPCGVFTEDACRSFGSFCPHSSAVSYTPKDIWKAVSGDCQFVIPDGPAPGPQPSAPTGTELRREVLKKVEECVCRDRQATHGEAEENFADIAALANIALATKLKEPLTAIDVALFHICTKLARSKSSPGYLDNYVDIAGYAVCAGGIIKRQGAE